MTLGGVMVSLMSYATAKSWADQISLSGNAHRFTPVLFRKIKDQTLWMIPLLVLLIVSLAMFRRKLENWLAENLPKKESWANLKNSLALSRFEACWLLLLVLVGIVFRLVSMQGIMKWDESLSYLQYARSPWVAISVYIPDASNHVFHTLLVSLITRLLGDSYWSIRSVDFFFGILLIPTIFFVARSIGKGRSFSMGWLSAAIVTAYPLFCEYSANARGYTLQIFLGLLMWVLVVQIYQGRKDLLLVLGATTALVLWTNVTSLYLFVGVSCALLGGVLHGRVRGTDLLLYFISAGILSFLLWSPVLVVSGLTSILASPEANPVSSGIHINPVLLRFQYLRDIVSLSLGWPGGLLLIILPWAVGVIKAPLAWRWIIVGHFLSILLVTNVFSATPPVRIWLFVLPLVAMMVDQGLQIFLSMSKGLYKRSGLIVGLLSIAYAAWVLPQVLDYGPGHKEISHFAQLVSREWSKGQAIEIRVEKSRLQKNPTGRDYYNPHMVRYYLERQGIPDAAFRWRDRLQSDFIWLISVQTEGSPPPGIAKKQSPWEVVVSPYVLDKHGIRASDRAKLATVNQ